MRIIITLIKIKTTLMNLAFSGKIYLHHQSCHFVENFFLSGGISLSKAIIGFLSF